MGLFNLFKKKGGANNEPNPDDQMLTLGQRQKPALKSDTKPPTAPAAPAPATMLTPDPEINNGQKTSYDFSESPAPEPEPQEYLRENLSTKSLEKSIESMPSVKKLVIPSNNEAMSKKVEATDTVTAERVPMKQIDLPGADKAENSIAPNNTNFVPGEFIDISISYFTDSIEDRYLSPNAKTLFDNSTKVRFTKDEILSIMAQGTFAVVGSALMARFPSDMVSEQGKTTSEVFEFPLDSVMAMIPPEWFTMQGQDESLTSSLSNMANPFQDLEQPEEEAKEEPTPEKAKTQSNSLFEDDSEDEQEIEVITETEEDTDPLSTIAQVTPPPSIEPDTNSLDTLVQATAPPTIPEETAKTDDSTLVVEATTIISALSLEIFNDFPQNASLKIPRERVLKSLSEGVFKLTAAEVDNFAGTSATKSNKENDFISIDLGLIMGLIPPEWFALQGQDNSQNDILTNMRDVFDDSTFEEAAREAEAEQQEGEILGETVVDANNLNNTTDEDDEEEISVETEEEEEAEDSLITGGIFSKMNNLFEDEDDEEEEVVIEEEEEIVETPQISPQQANIPALIEEENIEPPIIEKEEAPQTAIVEEENIEPPIIEEEEAPQTAIVEEESIEPPIIEEEEAPQSAIVEEEHPDTLQTVTISRDDSKIFDDQRLVEEQRKEQEATEKVKAASLHSMPTIVQLTPPPKVTPPKVETIPVVANETKAEETTPTSPEIEKEVANAGKVTYRPVNDDVPDMTAAAILRPSTAPNGIDINRSNLADLCRLHSAGEKLAQTLIEYREKNGDFKSINDLINVPGVGSSVYKSLTGLRPAADLVAAERRINKAVGLGTDKDYPLGKIITEAQIKFKFKSIILSDKDGFEICFSGDKSLIESNSELLAATTPQLFKKTKHFLKQSLLPHPEVFTFYLEDTPVTFGIADEVFMVMVHSTSWPEPKHMKQCRTLINELAWFCSYRAIV